MAAARLVDRPPIEEIAKRTAEAGAGLAAGAKAVGLADHREMLRDHARRVRDDHEWAKQLRGQEPSAAGGDEMGDIIVTGDIYGDAAVRALEKRKQSQPEQPQRQSAPVAATAAKLLAWPLAVAAGIAAGAGIMSLVDREPPPPVVVPGDIVFPAYDVERWVPGETPQ